jgi:hypothetical protein
MNKQLLFYLSALSLLAVGTGCVESSSDYTINPDGSGKVIYHAKFQSLNLSMGGEEPAPHKQAREAVKAMVEESQGIAAWSDVTYQALDDGRIQISGTAFFPNVNQVGIKTGASDNEGSEITFVSDDAGGYTLTYGGKESAETEAGTGREVTEAEIKKVRTEMQQALPMMSGFLSTMRNEYVFRLPGTVESVNNLTRTDDGALGLVIDGEKMMGAMTQLMNDDEWLRAQAGSGAAPMEGSPFGNDDKMGEMLFGQPGPIQATGRGATAPLFDYPVEAEAARAAFSEMMEALGIVAPVAAQPADGSGLSDVVVGGIQLVTQSDSDAGIRPFNEDTCYNVALIGQLPGAVLEVSEGELTKAVTDTGTDLLPDNEWNRKIHFPTLSERGDQVVFKVGMKLPEPDVHGMKEISGTLTYRVAAETKKVDLGITSFTADTAGSELGAVIEKIGKSEWSDEIVLTLGLDIPHSSIKEIQFFDAAGTPFNVENRGTMYSGDSTTLEFGTESGFPAAGRIVVEMYDNLQQFTTPFSVTDIDLLGRPLTP